MKLSELGPGSRAKIIAVRGRLKKRLQDMGIISGELIEVIKIAPLGDPIEVRIKGYNLSLRKNEAENIEVEVF